MKNKILSKVLIFLMIVTISAINTNIIKANTKSGSELLLDQCYENLDEVVITKDEIDVSKAEIQKFKELYKNKSYQDVIEYLRTNDLAIGVNSNSNARAIEGKMFRKLYPKKGTDTITLLDGTKKKITVNWNVLVTCSYSVNVSTEKISSLGTPRISLEQDVVGGDTQHLQLVAHKTNSSKINGDTRISLDISYSIKTKHYYYPYQDIKMGPYSIKDTI